MIVFSCILHYNISRKFYWKERWYTIEKGNSMKIVEQSCKANEELKQNRVIILCDHNGFTRMKDFLHDEVSDSLHYLDDGIESIDDIFTFTSDENYIMSCEDYIFINLLNVVLCSNMAKPIKNIPSIFYDVFMDSRNKEITDEVHRICNIDWETLKDNIDDNVYEIVHDMNWFDVSDHIRNTHLFIDVEIITTRSNADKLRLLFKDPMCFPAWEMEDTYIQPSDIKANTKEYKQWEQLMTNVTSLKTQLKNSGLSFETCKDILPGCSATKIKLYANMKDWNQFFDNIIESRIITRGPSERDLTRLMADYMLDFAFTEEFRNKLISLIEDVNTYEELPF